VEVQLRENKCRPYNATEDMQIATDSYLGHHHDYVVIPELLALWIGPHGVCNLRNLWWEGLATFAFRDVIDHCVGRRGSSGYAINWIDENQTLKLIPP
jgi:hypothetical protein